jgi:hypothetical protein
MDNLNIIEDVVSKCGVDSRLTDGIFSMENNAHMDILQEYLEKSGIPTKTSISIRNKMVEGKYPERQAYNVNGLLVTFPTPEYKQNAIARGTHFEENPKKAEVNLFQTDATAQQPVPTATTEPTPQTVAQPVPMEIPAPETKPAQPSSVETSSVETPSVEKQPKVDNRTPAEKEEDARAVQLMLSDAPSTADISKNYPNITNETVSYTLKEAKYCNFYQKNGNWFNADGKYVGKKWYCESSNQILITP